ncbi:uncharacterized protein BBA_00694 [Beauveria bassiana ARSEF 2860]|uniref:Uncharacterized protein n=1 Tax=Beauveria bassiana (strain ARSEF 2860) TaxID=655819 RepID=J4WJ51_BEAB2|nr:uncharacterized protein BBA_00694 [Beauveria bassiana ARSEF 2860]EJP69825.1 hypothetical protein BBA_00694 [Beauveria bassiana ARSEF 2860]
MPLTVDEAWSLIDDALKSLQSCRFLSVREQKKVLHALRTLQASPSEMDDPNQLRSPSMQKRRKFYGFLRMVLHSCGPNGVLVAAISLTQTTVSGMTNDHRNALGRKLASHKDWQLPANPHLQSFVAQLRAINPVGGTFLCQELDSHNHRPGTPGAQEKRNNRGPSMTPSRHIMWVGIPTGPDTMKHNPYLHVPICFKDLEIFEEVDSPFGAVSKDLMGDLKDKLGPLFLEFDDDKARNVVYVHQSVLMILFVARLLNATVEFYNWKSDKEAFTRKALASNHDQVLLFISNTSCDETAEDLYRVTDYLEAVRANVRVYPTKSEWSWTLQKVGDIRTLDDLAQGSNTWRPKTCFGVGECLLTQPQGGKMVLKRSHSCAGREVQVVAMTKRDKLLCKAPVPDQTAKYKKRGRYQGVQLHRFLYFHQEYVPTFRKTGEFRVWVCGGRVVCAFRTKEDENLPGKPMALRQLDINEYNDFNWYSPDKCTRKQKHDELLQFILDTDSRIRQLRSDRFDTVQIGARYDCGISPDHRFYVNELTRFANADTFSGLLAPPHDQIIGPLAKMIAQKFLM